MATIDTNHHIELQLAGERAKYGIDGTALVTFLSNFFAALRDFDRVGRGEPTRKTGAPEPAAAASVALRVVRLEPGSAVLTLAAPRDEDETALSLDDPPRAAQVVDDLLDQIEREEPLPHDVATSLETARRALGVNGTIQVTTTPRDRDRRAVRIDEARIATVTPPKLDLDEVTMVSGHMSKLEASPDRALIRAPGGTRWDCTYPPELVDTLRPLWRSVVYATGAGSRTSPKKGTFRIDNIAASFVDGQTELFTFEHIPTDVLFRHQGIVAPQGLKALSADELFDDATEDAYLAAIFGDDA